MAENTEEVQRDSTNRIKMGVSNSHCDDAAVSSYDIFPFVLTSYLVSCKIKKCCLNLKADHGDVLGESS